jgi:hypothetical protein
VSERHMVILVVEPLGDLDDRDQLLSKSPRRTAFYSTRRLQRSLTFLCHH